MGDLTDPCEYCGSERVAFLRYERNPTEPQQQTEWINGTPDRLYSIVCQDCGMGKAALDPRENEDLPDFEELPHGGSTSETFKVDDVLD